MYKLLLEIDFLEDVHLHMYSCGAQICVAT